MPRKVLILSLAVAALSVVLEWVGSPAAMAGERWRRPLPGGAVVGGFTFERSAPYVRGRRRGVDLAGRPGAPVVAACAGTVTHAGRVPGRFGRGVTLRCGDLVATELGLAVLFVKRGAHVAAGSPVGALDARGVLRLGARIATDRQGYLDPLALVDGRPPPVAPPAVAVTPRRRRAGPAPPPRGTPASDPAPATLPWPALAGLALLSTATLGGGAIQVRRWRRPARRTAPAGR